MPTSRHVSLAHRFDARLICEYTVSMDMVSAAALWLFPVFTFTWRMNLPLPSDNDRIPQRCA